MEGDVVDVLRGIKGIGILDIDKPPISDEDVAAGHKLAKQYLKESEAQVLIWGRVFTLNGQNVPKLYWTVAEDATPTKESDRYPLDSKNVTLPPIFISDLGNVLRLLVATEGATFAPDQGLFVANLSPFIAKVQNLLQTAQGLGWTPDDIARVRLILGDSLVALADQNGQNEPLQEAINEYELVLEVFTRSHDPIDWALTQNDLAIALWILGERESGPAAVSYLRQAVAAYEAALLDLACDREPLYWAGTQDNLGNALRALGERESGDAALTDLKSAVNAHYAALQVRTRDSVPLEWAKTQNNLGAALTSLAQREYGAAATTHLQQAVAAYKAALQVRNRNHEPLDWADTQNNLGNALGDLGERESGAAAITYLQQAVTVLNAALLECNRVSVPLDSAGTQNNLCIALTDLGERESGQAAITQLREAMAACKSALLQIAPGAPFDRALTQNNFGNALAVLGIHEHDAKELCDALQAHINAWRVSTAAPYDAAMDLTNAKIDLATLNAQFPPSALSACVASHADALRQMGIPVPNG